MPVILPSTTRWGTIFAALIFMIASIMVSATAVYKNDIQITRLKSEVAKSEELIRSLWQNNIQQENRLNMVAIHAALMEDTQNPVFLEFLKNYLQLIQTGEKTPLGTDHLPQLLENLKTNQDRAIERIDQTFVNKVEKEERISALEQKNLLFMSIALFAQLLSVATITIVRDLK